MSINRVTISGRLTREPEVRVTQSGMQILSFGVAVNDRRKNSQTGEWEDYANYVDCTLFGNRTQFFADRLSQGDQVFIEGKLRWSQWGPEGQKRSKLEVIVDDMELGRKKGEGANGGGSYSQQQDASAYSAPSTPVVDTSSTVYDEDIPF